MRKHDVIFLSIALVIVVGLGIALMTVLKLHPKTTVKSFKECADSPGSIIQTTYPETCITSDKKRFTQPQ
ncbi:MAG TPA: hypothetical protein VLG11_02315 [Candidatus Saccharimonadales bacterium]|nr:hypothetical protein [Candidatus Saccharimonadales bacterium]